METNLEYTLIKRRYLPNGVFWRFIITEQNRIIICCFTINKYPNVTTLRFFISFNQHFNINLVLLLIYDLIITRFKIRVICYYTSVRFNGLVDTSNKNSITFFSKKIVP